MYNKMFGQKSQYISGTGGKVVLGGVLYTYSHITFRPKVTVYQAVGRKGGSGAVLLLYTYNIKQCRP